MQEHLVRSSAGNRKQTLRPLVKSCCPSTSRQCLDKRLQGRHATEHFKPITETRGLGKAPVAAVSSAHHQDIWDCFEQLHELGEAVVAELALTAKVMMVGGDELIEEHPAVRLVAQKIHHLLSKLLGALNFLRSPI